MNLTKRAGRLGRSINTRTEVHGEELVPAIDVRVSELVINAEELDAILGAGAHEALFSQVNAGTPMTTLVRRLPSVKTLHVDGKLEGMCVTLSVPAVMGEEAEPPVILVPAKLKDVTLEPLDGGSTKLSMMVQESDPPPEDLPALMRWMGHEVEVSVRPMSKDEIADEVRQLDDAQGDLVSATEEVQAEHRAGLTEAGRKRVESRDGAE